MKLLIFDLDGTLIDSKLDLAHAVNATRASLGMEGLPLEVIAAYVGNGAPVLVRRAVGPAASEATVAQALEFFLAYYAEHMLDYTTVYPGVRDTLNCLMEEGRQMAVLTNKPVRMSKAIIQGLGLNHHFFQVYGGNSFEEKKPSPIGIAALLEEAGCGLQDALMIGDSAVDVKTARNAGVRSCGVTYGFQPETLVDCSPDFLIEKIEELVDLVNTPPKED
ncbi:MAG TPA: HAD-IA family hydrolase [Bryobacteraceae bacterium]|nr:HAD-IA family hydrolase [Bryobacteraceae bacterium]